ncbi:MAG: RICIN domain-containing protein [Bacteroidota bacterium]
MKKEIRIIAVAFFCFSIAFAQDTFIIQSALNNNLVLTPEGNNNGIRKEIKIKKYYRGRRTQHWKVEYSGDGEYFYLKSEASAYVLDVKGGSCDIRTPIWTYAKNRGNAQKWKKVNAGQGYFYLQSKLGHYLDVKGGQNKDGTPVWTYALNRGNAQRWKFVPSDPSFIPPDECTARPECNYLRSGTSYRVVSDAGEYALEYRTRDGLPARIFKGERRVDVEKMKSIMIDQYNIDGFCKVGNVIIPGRGGQLPQYGARGEKCERFNLFDLHIRKASRTWNVYAGTKNLFTTQTKEDALRLICTIRINAALRTCEVGSSFSPAFTYIRE